LSLYPPFHETLEGWRKKAGPVGPSSILSVDFEYKQDGTPTLLGLSAYEESVSVQWSPRTAYALRQVLETGCKVSGHNVIDADIPIIQREMKITIEPERIYDTIVYHQLANSWFQNVTNKKSGHTRGNTRGVGLLDLRSFAALYTDLPQWKVCRDGYGWDTIDPPAPVDCQGPCPVHTKRWYNATDAWAVDTALPILLADHESKGIPRSTVVRVQACMEVARKMSEKGINVDLPYVEELRRELETNRAEYFEPTHIPKPCGGCGRMSKTPPPCKRCRDSGRPLDSENRGIYYTEGYKAPFNPASPLQVATWFRGEGVKLKDASKETLAKALVKTATDHPAYVWLDRLYNWKDAGKGIDAWFGEQYISSDGLLHPRSIPIGTSSGRWASSGPNYQNIPKKKGDSVHAKIRGAIIPFPGEKLLRIDYGQMEYRHMLWNAHVWMRGDEMPTLDRELFTPLLPAMGDTLTRAAKINHRSPRDILKTVVYAAIYGEGARVYTGPQMEDGYVKKQIDCGALIVHRDWPVGDGFMGFTGANLADRILGSASWKNREIALAIQEQFFIAQPVLRELQRWLTKFVDRGHGTTATGRYLHLEGPLGDRFKDICAHVGQGAVDRVEEATLELDRGGLTPIMMVHDELVFSLPINYSDGQMQEIIAVMEDESKLFPGLRLPANAQVGARWLESELIEL